VASKVTVSPGTGDATDIIQSAIDEVSELAIDEVTGFRGAVLIEAGTYEVSSPIFIGAAGIVIRGRGSDTSGGTIIRFTSTENEDDLFTFGAGSGSIEKYSSTVVNIMEAFVPVGTWVLHVTSTEGYSVGDWIIIELQPNQEWIDNLSDMGQYGW
jgi:hypothetical protein